jgi:hypothetical protein
VLYRSSIRIIGATLLLYAVLVATHLGEFWPFSIYPMFSQAGNPWTRTLVRELPEDPDGVSWTAVRLDSLPGTPFPVVEHGLNQNDISNYVSKTSDWTDQRIRGFHSLFAKTHDFTHPLLVLKVRGTLTGDSVSTEATPVMLLERDTTRFRPSIQVSADSSLAPTTPQS